MHDHWARAIANGLTEAEWKRVEVHAEPGVDPEVEIDIRGEGISKAGAMRIMRQRKVDYVGRVYRTDEGFRGYTYGQRVQADDSVSFDGMATCVGPFDSRRQCEQAIRAENLRERERFDRLARIPFASDGSIQGAKPWEVSWLLAVSRHRPAWLRWEVSGK